VSCTVCSSASVCAAAISTLLGARSRSLAALSAKEGDMWQVLFKIPYLDVWVGGYGFFLVAGVVAGLALAAWLAARDGIDPERVLTLGLVVVSAGFVGAKAAWLLNYPGAIGLGDLVAGKARPGGVVYGSIVAGAVAVVLVARAMGLDWRRVADAAAPGAALGIALGRVGCFAAGCCWGHPTDHAWGVLFPVETLRVSGAPMWTPLHPVQLYEAALALLIAVALVALHPRRTLPGQVVLAFFGLYPLARFAVELWRGDDRGELFSLAAATGFSPPQLVSLALLAAAAAVALRSRLVPEASRLTRSRPALGAGRRIHEHG
jgi:phosphatidylglycerol:prolipoprotein diacylglycerol transferase